MGVGEQRLPATMGFFLTFLTVASAGVSSGVIWRKASFIAGAASAFLAVLGGGLYTLATTYRAAPYDQPAVLPPVSLFLVAAFVTALGWGAFGGVCGYLTDRLLSTKA